MTREPASGEAESGEPQSRTTRRRSLFILSWAAALVVVADQITKHLTVSMLADRPPVRLLGGAVYLVELRNSGAAFGLGSQYTYVFPLVAIVVVGWIIWMALRLRSLPWAVSLGLVLGGALGNLVDRAFRAPGPIVGQVVDMISVFDDHGGYFPVFNLADSALVIGVCLAVLLELTGRRRDGSRAATG